MDIIKLDQDLFLLINSFVGKSPFFDSLAKLLVNEYFVPTTLSLILFALWFYWEKSDKDIRQKTVLLGVLGIALGNSIVKVTAVFIQRTRPFEVLDTDLLFYRPTDPSFPSNAVVVAFVLATAIFLADKKIGLVALILSVFYGFSRIFVGVHFPLDVIGGAGVGVISVVIIKLFDKWLVEMVALLRNFLKRAHLEEFS